MEIAGTRNPRRKARYSGSPGGNQDHQPGRTGLRSAYRRAFPACSGPVCVTFMRGRAANDPPGPADNRGLLSRSGRCILPAICPVCSPACRSLVRPFERPRSHGPRTNSPAGSIDSQAGPALMPRARCISRRCLLDLCERSPLTAGNGASPASVNKVRPAAARRSAATAVRREVRQARSCSGPWPPWVSWISAGQEVGVPAGCATPTPTAGAAGAAARPRPGWASGLATRRRVRTSALRRRTVMPFP